MKKRLRNALLFCAVLAVGAVVLYFTSESGSGIPCVVNLFTGFYCAGCGTSRALRSLLHLEFYQAFRYNPLMILLLPFIVLYVGARVLDYVLTGGGHVDPKIPTRPLIWIVVLVLLYSVVRNLPFAPFVWLQPTIVT